MPFPMKIQPIDFCTDDVAATKPIVKSRLKRLFDRPFTSVLRISSAAEKVAGGGGGDGGGGGGGEFEPSSVCLDKMVRNFMEENEKQNSMMTSAKCGRNRCNCFNGSSNDTSDDEFGFSDSNSDDNLLKSLIPCSSNEERNLLGEALKIVEKNKSCKRKDDLRRIVTESLLSLNYDSSICKSKWEKSSSVPAGEYEYIDVIIEGERIIIDVDFRSEFEIARSTGSYKAVLQSLPLIFVGKTDRLSQIVTIVSEAARVSLKKKGMHIAPWRKAEFFKSKWLSSFTRITPPTPIPIPIPIAPSNDVVDVIETTNQECVVDENVEIVEKVCGGEGGIVDEGGEMDLIFGERAKTTSIEVENNPIVASEEVFEEEKKPILASGEVSEEEKTPILASEDVFEEGGRLDFSVTVPWEPPPVKERSNKAIVTGLASLLKEKP